MADDQLRDLVEEFRTRVQTELDAQAAALTATHVDMIERARQAAEAEAEQRWAAKLTAVHAEWDTRLTSEVAAARGELERRLMTEALRVRQEAEQAAAESAADLHRETEQAIAVERRRAAAELEQARASLEEQRRVTDDAVEQARRAGASRDVTHLLTAIAGIDAAASLSDILTAVVRGAAAEAPRASLFVVNGRQLDEWTAPGHAPLSTGPLAVDARDAGVLADVLRSLEPVSSATGDDGPRAPVFAAGAATIVAVPFVLERHAVAVLYADDGAAGGEVARGWVDTIQILGRHAATALAYLTAVRTSDAMRLSGDSAAAASQMTAGDDEQGARRYARLLVSEIKLYNEAAVRTGREKRDLLQRLAPEIDRARRMYDERVPTSMRARDFHFQQELVQTLAGGDASLLG